VVVYPTRASRQTDRQTDRQTGRQTHTHTLSLTHSLTHTHTHTHTPPPSSADTGPTKTPLSPFRPGAIAGGGGTGGLFFVRAQPGGWMCGCVCVCVCVCMYVVIGLTVEWRWGAQPTLPPPRVRRQSNTPAISPQHNLCQGQSFTASNPTINLSPTPFL
jgi:hypothetical protein